MKIAVSNLSFIGFNYTELRKLPPDVGIEIFYEFANPYYWQEFMSAIWGRDRSGGLSIHGPCIGINLANPNHIHYHLYYDRLFEEAARWEADYVVVHTNEDYEGTNGKIRNLVYDRLAAVMQIAQRYNVQVVLENVGLRIKNNLLFDWPEYQQLLQDFPQAGALLDVGHAHVNGWDLPETVKALGARLTACHLHDNDGHADCHLPIGSGTIQWADFFDGVRQYASQAIWVLEYANASVETLINNIDQLRCPPGQAHKIMG
ncbi:Hypothetical protein LUCI_2193 [Lucifera butyrica]|uniref:Xylose isomerase-like TIM barrel domain-containing protein n=1 Tax=Lucifera butyrica TaxID=1351585 RepID=A0A498R6B6_9FIRM|nr:sugar phosphate isomerase/epimerase [Lucifera butyrica]VBB06951.1 Hypothetical protein LUCI_2193 [Lucifera butyrica]